MKKILFIRSPRYNEFYLPESMSFQVPLGMCSVASYLKKSMPELSCEIIDCPAEKIGWHSLEKLIKEKKPDVVAAGEPQGFFYHETAKVFELAKRLNPETITIAGGSFFSSLPDFIFEKFDSVDFITIGESEITFTDLIRALEEKRDPKDVEGIVFKNNGATFHTLKRALIKNLDDLPLPCYDLLPMEKYSWYLHPCQTYFPLNLFFRKQMISPSVVLETSRGCSFECDFCSLWSFWADQSSENVTPMFRRKSVERTIHEIEIAYEKYGRRFFFFTDPTFNLQEEWSDNFCNELLKKNYSDIGWFAYLRPDFILRDKKNGILDKMARCGLNSAFIGAEKNPQNPLQYKGKTDTSCEAIDILNKKYPNIQTTVSFLLCMPEDSYDSTRTLIQYALKCNPTGILAGFFVFPGSSLYKKYSALKNFKTEDFFPTNYSPKFPYYALTQRLPRIKKTIFFILIRTNLILAQIFLLFNNGPNKIFSQVSRKLESFTYKNNIFFTLANVSFLFCLIPFLFLRRGISIRTCWLWKKPRWYNS